MPTTPASRDNSRSRLSSLCVLLILLASSPQAARAAWQPAGVLTPTNLPVGDSAANIILEFPNNAGVSKWTIDDVLLWSTNLSQLNGNTWDSAVPDGAGGATYFGYNGDIVFQHVSSTGVAGSVVTVCNAANTQNTTASTRDAAGSYYVVWKDQRSGTYQFFVQKVDVNGASQWTANGVLVTSVGLVSSQPPASVVADGAGGCIVLWQDARAGVVGPSDLYAQRFDATGTAQWTANGIAFCNAAGTQQSLRAVEDGAGGAIAFWMDQRSGNFDVYAQRINPAGASLWTANGVSIASPPGDQGEPALISDGAGGAFLTWSDCRNCGVAGSDIYAQHINSSGAVLWSVDGNIVTSSPTIEISPNLTTDGAGGIIVTWATMAQLSGAATDIFTQHLSSSGAALWGSPAVDMGFVSAPGPSATSQPIILGDGAGGAYIGGGVVSSSTSRLSRVLANGDPAWVPNYRPIMTAVADVPGDEGGWVSVNFTKPLSDGSPLVSPQTTGYSLWRRRPGTSATGPNRLVDERGVVPAFAHGAAPAKYSDFPTGTWDAVGYSPAVQAATYSLLGPTHTDYSGGSSTNDDFFVIGHTATPSLFVVSGVGSGYSVDNLPPGIPQAVAGGYAGGTTVMLHWASNLESDLWHYSVYKGNTTSFTPSASNRVGQPLTAAFQDDAYDPGVSCYKISAVDRHGNESGFALLGPGQITSVPPGTIPARSYLSASMPNPFRETTAIEYGLDHEARVSLAVYDLRGRRLARLVDEVQPAGVRRQIWSGLDDGRHVLPAGVYLITFAAGDYHRTEKIVLTR